MMKDHTEAGQSYAHPNPHLYNEEIERVGEGRVEKCQSIIIYQLWQSYFVQHTVVRPSILLPQNESLKPDPESPEWAMQSDMYAFVVKV